MNSAEAMKYIENLNKSGSIYGLERIRELLCRLGNPQDQLSVIHVAGTNGKGSFGAFLGKILEHGGYTAGRYISPAVFGYGERIQINGRWITPEAVADILTEIEKVCCQMVADGFEHPTVFEVETAMAFIYFVREKADYVILEAGLGGRDDSTNVVAHPLLSVITSVSMDHTAVLGDTLEKIADNKSGIIKASQEVLVYAQTPVVLDVMKAACDRTGSRLHVTDWSALRVNSQTLEKQSFDYKDMAGLTITMPGAYQICNAAAAADAARLLAGNGCRIRKEDIYGGLLAAAWPGRFEVVSKAPLMIVDGAHNPDGAAALGESIALYLSGKKIIFVAGIFKDKDYQKILKNLSPYAETVYTHQPPTDRGLPANMLAEAARNDFADVHACETLETALSLAWTQAEAEDAAIVAFGSLSTIGALKNWLLNQ